MGVVIVSVTPSSPAQRAGLRAGEEIVAINDHLIHDVLDYRFYMTDHILSIKLAAPDGGARKVRVRKGEYEDLGLEFESYLMDKKHTCRNKCIFCFVDQTPPGMRETLYFKDDDERLSFLFGNYITLTNLTLQEVQRIVRMHISPVNISVHTTNPALRVEMMKNPSAGEVLTYLKILAEGGIALNVQLVLCPGVNDGAELARSLEDLWTLRPALQSVAAVPVGLTRYREKLYPLTSYTPEQARDTIALIHVFADQWEEECGERVAYPADEFFLAAGLPIPPYAYYGDFAQLDNGVGLLALMEEEFLQALEDAPGEVQPREVSLATGAAAYPLLSRLAAAAMERCAGFQIYVYRILNDFFGHTVTVAGLITGQDLAAQLADKPLGQELLLPQVMLRHERDRFLDDMTVEALQRRLGVPVRTVENDGAVLLESMLSPCAAQQP